MSQQRLQLRFTLGTMLSVICVMAIYFAGFARPTPLWAGAAVSLTLTILLIALLWRLLSPAADATFWNGFQVAGWSYVALALIPMTAPVANVPLLTTRSLAHLHRALPLRSADQVLIEWRGTWYPGSVLQWQGNEIKIHYAGYGAEWDEWITPDRLRPGGFTEFMQTGDALLTLLFALAGGIVARSWPHRSSRRRYLLLAIGGLLLGSAGFATLLVASVFWASVALTVSAVVLIVATIGATTQRPRSAFLAGFALFGWAYLVLHGLTLGAGTAGPHLLTTAAVDNMHRWLNPQPTQTPRTALVLTITPGAYFHIIAHSYLALVAGVFGGLIGWWFARRRRGDDAQTPAVA